MYWTIIITDNVMIIFTHRKLDKVVKKLQKTKKSKKSHKDIFLQIWYHIKKYKCLWIKQDLF